MSGQDLLNRINFNENGLVAAIVQSENTSEVLMLAWMNEESFRQTLATKQAVFWSRSRNEIWHKGATSGNTQEVRSIAIDCDGDALLIRVAENGPACHTGLPSCFDTASIEGKELS